MNQTKPAGMPWAEYVKAQVAHGQSLTEIGLRAANSVNVVLSRTGHKVAREATRTFNSVFVPVEAIHRF